jgi:hypothetical protein
MLSRNQSNLKSINHVIGMQATITQVTIAQVKIAQAMFSNSLIYLSKIQNTNEFIKKFKILK